MALPEGTPLLDDVTGRVRASVLVTVIVTVFAAAFLADFAGVVNRAPAEPSTSGAIPVDGAQLRVGVMGAFAVAGFLVLMRAADLA